MKKNIVSIIAVVLAILIFVGGSEVLAADSFVFIKQSYEGTAPVFIGEKVGKLPLMELISDGDEKVKPIAEAIGRGMSKVSLALGGYVKKFMINEIKAGRSSQPASIFEEPLYIHIVRGGNMPKRGFYLKKDGTRLDKSKVHYIEMPPDPTAFESIFAHENGHLIDAYIKESVSGFDAGRFVHTAPAVSDYWTAFIEGWGEHFETMMVDMSANKSIKNLYAFENLKGNAYFSHLQDIANLSHKSKRYNWVKGNLFAFNRIPVSYEVEMCAGGDKIKSYLYNHFNSNFDAAGLKNIQQMLSTEGFVATLFYRMVNDEKIQSNYVTDASFYDKFQSVKSGKKPQEIFTPLENAYLKIIAAKYALFKKYEKEDKMSEKHIFIDFIKEYAGMFEMDARDAIAGYCMNTYFAGVWEDASRFYRNNYCASHLTLVDPGAMQTSFQKTFDRIRDTIDEIGTTNVELLYKYAAVPLWIVNDTFNMGDESEKFFISININSAEEFELASISFLSKKQAADIVKYREENGLFKEIGDLKKISSLTKEQLTEFDRMRKLFTDKNTRHN